MRGTFVICWSFVNFNHFLLLAPFRNKTVSQLCTILALTSYLKCVDVCRYFADDCLCRGRQAERVFRCMWIDCFAIHHSFITINLSTLALCFLPSPCLHLGSPPCRYTLKIIDSIHSISPLKCLSFCAAVAVYRGKNKTETKAHSVRCETRLTGQMPMIQISSSVGVCVLVVFITFQC